MSKKHIALHEKDGYNAVKHTRCPIAARLHCLVGRVAINIGRHYKTKQPLLCCMNLAWQHSLTSTHWIQSILIKTLPLHLNIPSYDRMGLQYAIASHLASVNAPSGKLHGTITSERLQINTIHSLNHNKTSQTYTSNTTPQASRTQL